MNSQAGRRPTGTKGSTRRDDRLNTPTLTKTTGTVDRAINDIRYIRDLIDTSRDFFVSGWSGVAAGLVLVLGVVVTAWLLHNPSGLSLSGTLWTLWILIGTVVLGIDILSFVRRSREEGRPIFSTILVKGILVEAIVAAQGLIMTFLFSRLGMTDLIPGAWLMTLGTVMTALGIFVPGGAWIIGLVSLASSVTAFVVPGLGLYCLGLAGAAMVLWGVGYLIVCGK